MRKAKTRPRVLVVQAWWSHRFLEGVARYAMEKQWVLDCEMAWTGNLPEAWSGDGIIVYADQDPQVRKFVREQKLPTIDISTFRDDFSAPKVMISNELIVRTAVRHMLDLGFEHLCCVHSTTHPVDRIRHAIFAQEVRKAGKIAHEITIKDLPTKLKSLPNPMGLLASADHYAAKIIASCKDAGFSVPEEFAVVSINNTPILCDLTSTPITSVDPDFERNGYEAARLLEKLMNGKTVPRETIIPPKGLIQRRSTDTLCIADPDTAKALRYIRDHYLQPISISEVASGAQSSLRRIQSSFLAATGSTMVQELCRLRIEHAKKLLQTTNFKIDRVAKESGFASRTYFIRTFRKTVKATPRNFRKKFLPQPKRSSV